MELPYERKLYQLISKRAFMRDWAFNAGRRFGKPELVHKLAPLQMAKELLSPEQYKLFKMRYAEAIEKAGEK